MAFLGIDTSNEDVLGEYTPVPPGDYIAHIISNEVKENGDRTGHYVKLTFEILDGDHAGRQLSEFVNFDHPNSQTVQIARRTLQTIAVACGRVSFPPDADEVMGIPMQIVVEVSPPSTGKNGKQYGPSNSIKNYKVKNGNAQTGTVTNGGFGQQQAAASGGSAAPWKRAS